MEQNEIENIIDDLPFGIAVVAVSLDSLSPLLAGLQIGKMLGLPMPDDTDVSLSLIAANAQFGKLMLLERRGAEGQDFREILRQAVLKEDLDEVEVMINRSLSEKASCDFRVKTAEGEIRWLSADGHALSTHSGSRTMLYSFSDITFRKREQLSYQQELEYMEGINTYNIILKERYNLTQNRLISYRIVKPMAGDVRQLNTYDEIEALHLESVFDGSDRARLQQLMDRREMLLKFRSGQNHIETEYRRKDASHKAIWIRKILDLYSVPFSDEIECYVRTYDISENVIMRSIIAQMEKKKHAHFGIIDVRSGSFVSFSQIEGKREGRDSTDSYDATIGQRSARMIPAQNCEEIRHNLRLENILKELQSKDIFSQVAGYRNENQDTQWMRLDYFYLTDSRDKIVFLENDMTVQHDKEQEQVDRLKQALEAREKAIEAKSSFFSSMSHDLRTPLNGIIGFTEIALQEKDPARAHEYLEKIKASGDLLMDLVNDTLDISRIDSGKMVLESEQIEEGALVKTLIDAVQPSAELKHVSFISRIEVQPDELVETDPLKLKKVFLNLLFNAIKFTPTGGTVSLQVMKLNPPVRGCTRRIIVEDTGIGMSREFLEKLYEPFAQENRPESRGLAGTGLGLTIVKRIVDLMNGTLEVESEIGRGTRFTVDLPILPAAVREQKAESAPCDHASLAGRRVLLCEDNRINTEVALIHLKEAGMEVDCAENGLEAVKLFEGSELFHYDIILMDIRMPVMDGYEATREIRKLSRKDALKTPILAMTADAFEEDIRHCREVGMDGHIAKPISPDKLLHEICCIIRR